MLNSDFLHLLLTHKVCLLLLRVYITWTKQSYCSASISLQNLVITNAPSIVIQITSLDRDHIHLFFYLQFLSSSLMTYYHTHALAQYSTKFTQQSEHIFKYLLLFTDVHSSSQTKSLPSDVSCIISFTTIFQIRLL
jgi:hypothetical protein